METKSAFIALVGRPNVGKSTLTNTLVGEKVSIVSHKPQTTRNRITGIITIAETQYVLLDTPGWHKPHNKLSDYMLKQVQESLSGIDLALFITEPTGELRPEELELLEHLKRRHIPAFLVLNKIDTLKNKEDMMPKIAAVSQQFAFEQIIPISAKNGEGVALLQKQMAAFAKEAPHFFATDDFTDQPERVIIAEIIREKMLFYLEDELPYGVAVAIDQMKERDGMPIIDIYATIYCERPSHKGMIIGKQGQMLRKIGSTARKDIEEFLDCKINLQLWVKVKEDWRNREHLFRQFGFQ